MVVEFGALFEGVSHDVYPDLVGPTYEDVAEATDAVIGGRVVGVNGVVVQREDGGPWKELHTGVEAAEWVARHPSTPQAS